MLSPSEIERLYTLRRDLVRLRNAIVPLVEVCRRIEHAEMVAIDAAMQPLFRDVTDHVRRVQEEIEFAARGAGLRLRGGADDRPGAADDVSRRLAAYAAILAVPTAVAGIYGMNFKNMPELQTEYGYFVVLAFIIATCAVLFWRFKKYGWL